MRLSVIIVTTGASPVLDRCLAAVAAGARTPDEVILVDQTRGLAEDAARWLGPLSGALRYVAADPMGVSRARNLGAATATGDFLAFTDDDCVPAEHWLAGFADAIDRLGAQAASSRVLALEDPTPGLVGVSLRTASTELVYDGNRAVTPWDIGTGASLLVSAERFALISGFDEAFGPGARFPAAEDIDLLERLMEAGVRVVYAPGAVVYHQMKARRAWLGRQVPYGIGMGAMVARAERSRRGFLTRSYMRMLGTTALGGLRRARWKELLESLLMGVGFLRGYVAMRFGSR